MPRPRRRKPSTIELPLLPRRRGILFPNTSGPILVGRKTSLRAVDEATAAEGIVAVVTQRDPSMSDLAPDDVFPIATESIVNRALRLPDGSVFTEAAVVMQLVADQKPEAKLAPRPVCGTRMWPRRTADVLAGGSLYWVIKGSIAVRQKIIAIEDVRDNHGLRCGLYLGKRLYRTVPAPRRAFQGWRYLEPEEAPADLAALKGGDSLPEEMRRKLAELGAW